jgi:transposase
MTSIKRPSQDWREARRLRAWALYQQGWKQRTIAEAFGVSEGAVSQWLQKGRQQGIEGLHRVPRPGAPPRLTDAQRAHLLALLDQGAEAFGFRGQVWTGPRVAHLIDQHFGVSYHPHYVTHLLKTWGWSWQKPQKKAQQRDEGAIAQWHQETWPALQKKSR